MIDNNIKILMHFTYAFQFYVVEYLIFILREQINNNNNNL